MYDFLFYRVLIKFGRSPLPFLTTAAGEILVAVTSTVPAPPTPLLRPGGVAVQVVARTLRTPESRI